MFMDKTRDILDVQFSVIGIANTGWFGTEPSRTKAFFALGERSARGSVLLKWSRRQDIENYQRDQLGDKEQDMATLKVILLEDLIGNYKGRQ